MCSMPVWDVTRAASTMRSALVGRPMTRFEAPKLIGPVPQAGRTVESVEAHGKHIEVSWDDGLVLDTHLKGSSEWHVYRTGTPWRSSWDDMRASIGTDAWVAVCFRAPNIETYRQSNPTRHPGHGRLGADLVSASAHLADIVDLLLSHPHPETRLRDVLVDQHVMQGLGNVYCCEVLWAAELSPWAHVADLTQADAMLIVNTAARMLRSNRHRTARPDTQQSKDGLAVYGRSGQGCSRCRETIEARTVGQEGRTLYWCPGCQVRLDRRLVLSTNDGDPHPAAARFLQDLPWRIAGSS